MSSTAEIILRTVITIITIICLTRLHGLRSFSKMSAFDFAITVSIGSVLAGTITTLSTPLWHFLAALTALFAVQIIASQMRARNTTVANTLDNTPLLIMKDGTPLPENLARGGMTHDDLWAKLREANALDHTCVHAVVLESTGDVSVLHGPAQEPGPTPEVMSGVRQH